MFFEGTQVCKQVRAIEHSDLNMHSQLVLVYPRREHWSLWLVGKKCNSVANNQSPEEDTRASAERPQPCQCRLTGPQVLLCNTPVFRPSAVLNHSWHKAAWWLGDCGLPDQITHALFCEIFKSSNLLSQAWIFSVSNLWADLALRRSHGYFLLQLKSRRFINWDYASHR